MKSTSRFIYTNLRILKTTYNNILPLRLLLRSSRASSLASWTTLSKEFLEFFKYITEWILLPSTSLTSTTSELVIKSFKPRETLSSTSKSSSKRILPSLLLFIRVHASLIIDTSFAVIAKGLVCFIDGGKFLLSLWCLIDIWMVLLGQLEIRLLYLVLRRTSPHIQRLVIILIVENLWCTKRPLLIVNKLWTYPLPEKQHLIGHDQASLLMLNEFCGMLFVAREEVHARVSLEKGWLKHPTRTLKKKWLRGDTAIECLKYKGLRHHHYIYFYI